MYSFIHYLRASTYHFLPTHLRNIEIPYFEYINVMLNKLINYHYYVSPRFLFPCLSLRTYLFIYVINLMAR